MNLAETVAHLHNTVVWNFRILLILNMSLYLVLIWLILGRDKDKNG